MFRLFQAAHRLIHTNVTSLPLAKLGKFSHLAFAFTNFSDTLALYRNVFNVDTGHVIDLPHFGVSVVMIKFPDTPTAIELAQPFPPKSHNNPLEKFLQKNSGGGPHHICFDVSDIHATLRDLQEAGIRCLEAGLRPRTALF
jgi:methylmalonyl-CoA/ethylmalonyl-CoA epimerase